MLNGQPICDDHWDKVDAMVVCRALGFPGALEATTRSKFGLVGSDFLLTEVACTGEEEELTACSYSTHHSCGPGEAAGVVCQGDFASDY